MTYQSTFTFLPQPKAKTTLQGILAKVALGEFVLGRAPSTKPASQAARCPYRPLHLIDNGQQASQHVVAGQQLPTKPAVLTPSYPSNTVDVDTVAQDLPVMPAILSVTSSSAPAILTVSPAVMPATTTPAYPTAPPEEATTSPYRPESPAGPAITQGVRPAVATNVEPQKPAPLATQLPTKAIECK